jgi:hypothetical protein
VEQLAKHQEERRTWWVWNLLLYGSRGKLTTVPERNCWLYR